MIALDGKFARDNLALVTSRMTKGEDFAHALLTDTPVEVICLSPKTSNNGFVFPLWVPDKDGITRLLNIAPTFSAALAQALGRTTVRPYDLPDKTLAADILAYVYAVLHAPSFRRCYSEFLKSDFPRIPISLHANATDDTTFADVWSKLVPVGHELIDLHLLRKVPSALLASFPVSGGLPVEKPRYEPPNSPMNSGSSGRVYINMTQYFDDVEPETWSFTVGGYQVCEKWLKDRKGRTLSYDDTAHYSKIVAALTRTRALMRAIDAVADGTLWASANCR